MLASLDPSVLELYSRDDVVEIFMEYGTPQQAVWVGREVEFNDHGQENIAINTLGLRFTVQQAPRYVVWHYPTYLMQGLVYFQGAWEFLGYS
jgi:hypothetical protein